MFVGLPSHDCHVCTIERFLKGGSGTVPRDWATRRSQVEEVQNEIPVFRLQETSPATGHSLISYLSGIS
jgi:hypothetical protein